MSNVIERGGLWVLAQLVLIVVVVMLATHTGYWTWPPDALGSIGVLLLVLGSLLGAAAFVALGKNLTPFPQPRADGTLTRRAVYAYVRHPMYLALMVLAFGWACAWHSAAAALAALFMSLFFDRKARREERWLREKFSDYDAYCKRVARFLPGIY